MTQQEKNIRLVRSCISHVGIPPIFDRIVYGNSCIPSSIKKVYDWFWSFEIDENTPIEYEYVNYSLLEKVGGFGCTSMRLGKYHMRNLDWYINKDVECYIHTLPNEDRYESWGIASSNDELQEQLKVNETTSKEEGTGELLVSNNALRNVMTTLVDGINEYGLSINVNVVPHMGRHTTIETGTNPTKPSLCHLLVARYILDHFKCIDEALDWLKNDVNVFFPNLGGYECHWMICDSDKTVIIELNPCNGDWSFIEVGPDKEYPAIMTNFHITGTKLFEDGMHRTNNDFTASESLIGDFGSGVERYNILYNLRNEQPQSIEEAYTIISNVLYKQYIANTSVYWPTEFVGGGLDSVLKVYSKDEDFQSYIDYVRSKYEEEKKYLRSYYNDETSNKASWATTHTSIFDIDDKKIYVKSGEDIDGIEKDFYHN